MGGKQNQLTVPEVRHPGLTGKLRRQEALYKSCKGAQVARFGEQGLQLALGRKNAVESGKSHGLENGREGLCRLS
jgi:hypothetical protein